MYSPPCIRIIPKISNPSPPLIYNYLYLSVPTFYIYQSIWYVCAQIKCVQYLFVCAHTSQVSSDVFCYIMYLYYSCIPSYINGTHHL